MRMVEGKITEGFFNDNPTVQDRIMNILSLWTFAEVCCVDVSWNQEKGNLECYFRCPQTEAGVFLPVGYLEDSEYVEWLRRSLEDTLDIAERRNLIAS